MSELVQWWNNGQVWKNVAQTSLDGEFWACYAIVQPDGWQKHGQQGSFHLFYVITSTLDARGLLARQRRGASERVELVGEFFSHRFATRLRSYAAQFCRPQREKKTPLAPRVNYVRRKFNTDSLSSADFKFQSPFHKHVTTRLFEILWSLFFPIGNKITSKARCATS